MTLKYTDSDLSAVLAKGREEALTEVLHEIDGALLDMYDYATSDIVRELSALRKRILALSPSSPGEPAGSGWQPISTAPKMKTILLFAVTDRGASGEVKNWKIATGFWHSGYGDTTDHDYCPWNWEGRQLRHYETQPTCWQPLPEPPHEPTGET